MCPPLPVWRQFLAQQLSAPDAEQLQAHLVACENCLEAVVSLRSETPEVVRLHALAALAQGAEKSAAVAELVAQLRTLAPETPSPAAPATVRRAPVLADPVRVAAPDPRPAPRWRDSAALQCLAPPQQADELGRMGPYRVLEVLGSGGMGVVFRAEDEQLKRPVAIKVMSPDAADNPESRQRFIREAQATAAIESDYVVPVFQVGEDRGIPYLAMPVLKGLSLEGWLGRHGIPPLAQTLRLGREVALGLSAAHEKGLMHRDVKPGNIWLEEPTGRAKLLDFGLARAVNDHMHLTQSGAVAGTPSYMAPEQARGLKVDPRCDLFSLGCVLYRMSTGELPFGGDSTMAVLTALALDPAKPVEELRPDLPPAFAALIMQLIEKDPQRRPATAREVAARIQAIEQAGGPGLVQPGFAPVGLVPGQVRLGGDTRVPASGISLAPAFPGSGNQQPAGNSAIRAKGWPWIAAGAGGALVVALAAFLLWRSAGSGDSPGLVRVDPPKKTNSPTKTPDPVQPPEKQPPEKKVEPSPVRPRPPDPPTAGKRPVKVFILAGQSDMAGRGAMRTLPWLGEDPVTAPLLSQIKRPDGSWAVRDDVWIFRRHIHPGGGGQPDRYDDLRGKLTVGFGQGQEEIGPELHFGHLLGDRLDNQVLLIKVVQGPLSLNAQGRPPSSGGVTGKYYQELLQTVKSVLESLPEKFPEYAGQGYELAGLVWFQGWNDYVDRETPDANRSHQYVQNLVHFIQDLRRDLGAPNLPVVVGELGVGGVTPQDPKMVVFRKAQAEAVAQPEFAGNVALVKTSELWDDKAGDLVRQGYINGKWIDKQKQEEFDKMGSNLEYLYLGSAKIFSRIGHAFGEAMVKLLPADKPAK